MNKEPYFLTKFIGGICAIAGGSLFLSAGTKDGIFSFIFGLIILLLGFVLILSLAKSNFDRKNKK